VKSISGLGKEKKLLAIKKKEYIKYKALERGILVIEVPEFNTSKQCSKCGSMNISAHSPTSPIARGGGHP